MYGEHLRTIGKRIDRDLLAKGYDIKKRDKIIEQQNELITNLLKRLDDSTDELHIEIQNRMKLEAQLRTYENIEVYT